MASTHRKLVQYAEALPLRERALAITEAAYGPDHPTVADRLRKVAFIHWAQGHPGMALPLEERALAIMEAAYGPDHPEVADRLDDLDYTYRDLNRTADAERARARAEAIRAPRE
jgi:hypothetical protein